MSFKPGVELVLEAFEGLLAQTAIVKDGEVDVAFLNNAIPGFYMAPYEDLKLKRP